VVAKSNRFLELISFPNFFDADIFVKKFEKVDKKEVKKNKQMEILMTEYGFDSNITGCKLFESETNENEAFGLTQTQLEENFYQNKVIEEDGNEDNR
jgi:hypothetical protein